MHGIILGLAILANRCIPTTTQCFVCSAGPEDVKGLMFTCTRAKNVWGSMGLMDIISGAACVDRLSSTVLEELLRRQNNKSPVLGHVGLNEFIIETINRTTCEHRRSCGYDPYI